jgi:hypothetical protein
MKAPHVSGASGCLEKDLKIQEVIPKDKEGDTKPIRIYSGHPQRLRKPSQL